MTTGKELYDMYAHNNPNEWIKVRAGMYVHKSGMFIENREDPSFPWLLINSSGHALGSATTAARARELAKKVAPENITGRPKKYYS